MSPVLTYYNVAEGVMAFSTTRHGGVSKGSYGEFNINNYCGDNPADISANRQLLEREIDILDDNLLMPHQVHGIRCRVVTRDVLYAPKEMRSSLFEGYDSLVTDVPGVCIGVSTADCIPILLYDSRHHAVAAVHAGWRGTADRVVLAACQTMYHSYLTRFEDITAVIGPGISLKNFEVGQEVYDAFADRTFDMSLIARKFPRMDGSGGEKWHIDLPLCNQLQLELVGVPRKNIILSGICTFDHVDDYFSARRLGQASGRIFTGIMMKS